MAMDPTFAKLVAVGIMGGVVKSLLGTPRPVTHVHNHPEPTKPSPGYIDYTKKEEENS